MKKDKTFRIAGHSIQEIIEYENEKYEVTKYDFYCDDEYIPKYSITYHNVLPEYIGNYMSTKYWTGTEYTIEFENELLKYDRTIYES
jgi:hypothetical protein